MNNGKSVVARAVVRTSAHVAHCLGLPAGSRNGFPYLLVVVPLRSRRIFVELLVVGYSRHRSHNRETHWTTYYKLIERAHVSAVDFPVRLLQTAQKVFPNELVNLIIDDTLIPRYVKSGSDINHNHSRKPNRPTFLNSQCWVRLGSALTIPIRSWLVEESANESSAGWRNS